MKMLGEEMETHAQMQETSVYRTFLVWTEVYLLYKQGFYKQQHLSTNEMILMK